MRLAGAHKAVVVPRQAPTRRLHAKQARALRLVRRTGRGLASYWLAEGSIESLPHRH